MTSEGQRLSVASVTVAFNEAHVVPRQMDAILRQTRPLQEIIVVDNASSDELRTMLSEHYPQVTVLTMRENLGVGGALAAGMAYAALEKRHDWVWTFDADSVPKEDALEALLGGARRETGTNGDLGILASMPVHRESGDCYPPLLWRDGFVKPSTDVLQQPMCYTDLVISSGCMVRRDVVEKIGLPRADFFMDFIDFEYCLRARSHGYKVAVVTGSRLEHEIGNARRVRLFGSRLWPGYAPWREYYLSRNIAYAVWRLYPSPGAKRFVVRHLARHAMGVALFSLKKLACLKMMAWGFGDGVRGRMGARFRPPTAPENKAQTSNDPVETML